MEASCPEKAPHCAAYPLSLSYIPPSPFFRHLPSYFKPHLHVHPMKEEADRTIPLNLSDLGPIVLGPPGSLRKMHGSITSIGFSRNLEDSYPLGRMDSALKQGRFYNSPCEPARNTSIRDAQPGLFPKGHHFESSTLEFADTLGLFRMKHGASPQPENRKIFAYGPLCASILARSLGFPSGRMSRRLGCTSTFPSPLLEVDPNCGS